MKAGGFDIKNTMEYKDYIGTVEFSEEEGIFFGKVTGIRALISCEGHDAKELVRAFMKLSTTIFFCVPGRASIPKKPIREVSVSG